MLNDNAQQLQKLAQIINVDKIISSQEIEDVLKAIVQILANNKKEVQVVSEETKQQANDLFNKIVELAYQLRTQVDEKMGMSKSEMDSKMSQMMADCKMLIEEAKALMPADGKDADEEKIVEDVLAKINLPEYKETVLDSGEIIIEKINDTSDDSPKIKATRVEGLDKKVKQDVIAFQRNVAYYDETTLVIENATKVKFTGSGVSAALDAEGTLVVTVSGGAGNNEAYEDATPIGDDLNYTIAHTPVSNTLLVINGNTGQIYMPTTDYTLVGTTITFLNAQTGVTVRARYAYA